MATNVIDVPRDPSSPDFLDITQYVTALETFLRGADMPITVAIQGEWGSGKTSLMNQVYDHLCDTPNGDLKINKDGVEFPYHGIWTKAWQYSLVGSPSEILMQLIKSVINNIDKISKQCGSSMDDVMRNVKFMFKGLAEVSAKAAATSVGLSASVVGNLFNSDDEGKSSIEALQQALETAIQACLKHTKKRGFIFFIDDLDRLDPVVAVQFLELVKNIFDMDHCIFVLAIDYEVVVKGLRPKFGELTEKNEREFRCFFDKIIQVPFNMPIDAYAIESYIKKSLTTINYFDGRSLNSKLPLNNTELHFLEDANSLTYLSALTKFTEYSVGKNPRSIKRLINTLSLVNIMQQINEVESQNIDKLVSFCLISIQTAYPSLYTLLWKSPDFTKWNQLFASENHLPKISEEQIETLSEYEEFDEQWEQVLYRACRSTDYLRARAIFISRLLNLLKALVPEEELENAILKALGASAVTEVNSGSAAISSTDNVVGKRKTSVVESLDDYCIRHAEQGYAKHVSLIRRHCAQILKILYDEERETSKVDFEGRGNWLSVVAKKRYRKGRSRTVARFEVKTKKEVEFGIWDGDWLRWDTTSEADMQNPISEEHVEQLLSRMADLSSGIETSSGKDEV